MVCVDMVNLEQCLLWRLLIGVYGWVGHSYNDMLDLMRCQFSLLNVTLY
jgi:hypothetical protein